MLQNEHHVVQVQDNCEQRRTDESRKRSMRGIERQLGHNVEHLGVEESDCRQQTH